MNRKKTPPQEAIAQQKKRYSTPRLIEYGTIAKLTQSTGPVGTGDGPIMMMVPCL